MTSGPGAVAKSEAPGRAGPWPRTPPALALLSTVNGALGRFGVGRSLLRELGVRRWARRWLRSVVAEEGEGADDVTVLIGIRNRTDYRLRNALRSIRDQELPGSRVEAMVVDYGSAPSHAARTREACEEFGGRYVRVEGGPVWSRARCLNEGIRRATTTFLMTSDADILLSPGYLAEAIRLLRQRPLSVVCAPMLDLPPSSVEATRRAARLAGPLPLEAWRPSTRPRLDWDFHPSIAVTRTSFHRLVRGYDEAYEVWGDEDVDLMQRLRKLGLEPVVPDDDVFYLHQWHPKHENVPEHAVEAAIARNRRVLESRHSIVRNAGP